MFLESREIIDRPLEQVYSLVKDDFPKIATYLPNIERVEQVQKENLENGKVTKILNHWYAKVEVPDIAKKFIKKELFSWKDKALWKNEEFCVHYELESFWASNLFDAKGVNYFKAIDANKTELKLTCEITLHPENVPGVPTFLVKKVLPLIEDIVKGVLEPNLMGLGQGIKRYFNEQK